MNNVVIIDDSTVVRKIVETSLRRIGVACISYQDGLEALQAFKKGQNPIPDLIFLDIGLPKLDGYDVLRLLKTSPEFDHTAVVMLSARDGVLDRLKCRLAGARDYITKPFTTQNLVSVALSYLEQSVSTPIRPGNDDVAWGTRGARGAIMDINKLPLTPPVGPDLSWPPPINQPSPVGPDSSWPPPIYRPTTVPTTQEDNEAEWIPWAVGQ